MIYLLQAAGAVADTLANTAAAIADTAAIVTTTVIEAPAKPELSPLMKFFQEYSFVFMIGLMVLVFWLFMWRPDAKRRKQAQEFRNGLKKGDKIVTAGGIYGTIKEVKDNSLLIEVDSNVTLRIDKNFVTADPTEVQK